ncbi:MAG: MerR family transcriptional regulator [Pseudomonadota bacterium]
MSRFRTAKQTADMLGLSVKALRLYEAHGLVAPGRTAAGWRVYGPEDVAALHKVAALKSIGFSLAEIARLIRGGVDLAEILAAQSAAIEARRRRLGLALAVLDHAQARIAAGEGLSTDDLIKLSQETIMSDYEWTDAHEALASRHYTPDQMKTLEARKISPEMQATLFAKWQELVDEAERLRHGPADAPEALNLARRWSVLAETFTQGDPALAKASAAWYEDGFSNPETAKLMPFSKEVWAFVAAATSHLPPGEAGQV